MKLSDGQEWTGLNTGVVVEPSSAGLWTPEEHQHRIRAEDIDLIAKKGVQSIVVGRGVTGDGVAELMADAVQRMDELKQAGVKEYVSNTYNAVKKYNKLLAHEPAGTVGALFHTGC